MAALVASCLLGMLLGAMLVFPLLRGLAKRINGGPFAVRDPVLILTGPQRGRVGLIYELWPMRGQVRVDLGAAEKKSVTDVIGDYQVLRVR